MLDDLNASLASLVESGGTENALLLTAGTGWFHIRVARGVTDAVCHAAANAYLPPVSCLMLSQVQRLRDAGFALRDGERALSQTISLASEQSRSGLLSMWRDLFDHVYGAAGVEWAWAVTLGDAPTVRNPGLETAVRAVAKQRLPALRQALYRELMRSELLLLVDEEDTPSVVGDVGGWPTFAVFSDNAALRMWDPRGGRTRLALGRTLFPSLMRHRFGSVLLNPHGRLGGELYRNEVEALANAALGRSG
jgi:hypothetical protein